MKILLVNNMAPFVWGGAEELAANLQKQLTLAGHKVEIMRIPFQWEPAERVPSQMLMVRCLELYNVDRVIAFKFPAYLIRHPHKTLWLVHQYRQAYDLWDAGQSNFPVTPEGNALRDCVIQADNNCFEECKKIFTNSSVTAQRLKKYNNKDSTLLLPPLNDEDLYFGDEYGSYIFAGGRINSMKRQNLLLKALKKTKKPVKLIIGGPADTSHDKEELIHLVEELQLGDRVKLDIRFLPRSVYANYLNNSLAVAYLPYDEDSLGYVSMEGANASKAMIEIMTAKVKSENINFPLRTLGPVKFTYGRINGKYRYRIILKCRNNADFRKFISDILIQAGKDRRFSNVSVYADINGEMET